MTAQSLDRHLVSTPDTLGGKIRITGRRIAVADIAVWRERMAKSVEEICAEHELTLAEVHAALAYYFDNKSVTDQQLSACDAAIDAARASNPSVLERKLRERGGGNSSIRDAAPRSLT